MSPPESFSLKFNYFFCCISYTLKVYPEQRKCGRTHTQTDKSLLLTRIRASCATTTSKDGNSKGRVERGPTTEVMCSIIVHQPAGGCTSGVTQTKSKESQRKFQGKQILSLGRPSTQWGGQPRKRGTIRGRVREQLKFGRVYSISSRGTIRNG